MAEAPEEKAGSSDTWDRKLKWVKDNTLLAIAIFFAWMFWDERKDFRVYRTDRENEKTSIIKEQGGIIHGYEKLNTQAAKAERKYTIKTDTIYAP